MKKKVFYFDCHIDYYSVRIVKTIVAETHSKARYKFYQDNFEEESYKDLFKFIKVYKRGICNHTAAIDVDSEVLDKFNRIKQYRRLDKVKIGMKVQCDGKIGQLIGGNDSSNFDVDFGDGIKANCHPHYKMTYFDQNNNLVYQFN